MASKPDDSALQEKVRFHQDLAALDESDDDNEDVGLLASVDALRRPVKKLNTTSADTAQEKRLVRQSNIRDDLRSPKSLPRSISDLRLSASRKSNIHASPEKAAIPNHDALKAATAAKARHTFSGALSPASSMPQATGKRKRESVKLMPQDQQTFSGLHFYFFPNNEKNPARFMRISKAIVFGATWHRDWTTFVTHVIVDKAMDYTMLMRFLKMDALPIGVICVNESWPSECIAYRALLDHSRPQFKVCRAPALTATTTPLAAEAVVPISSVSSETSLKLKPPGMAVMARLPETQPSGERSAIRGDTTTNLSEAILDVSRPGFENAEIADELDIVISQAKDLQLMPLDDDDGRPGSSEGLSTNITSAAARGQQNSKLQAFQEKFQCMQEHNGEVKINANSATIVILQQMADYYGQVGDEWRVRAYRKAIATLRNHPTKVCTKDEALALPNVGDRLASKIEEIVFTSRLRRLDNALAEPQDQILQTFIKVYGVGFAHASQWVRQGYTTLDELLQKANLSDNQKIGIAHFEDFQERIPRTEVTRLGEIVREALHELDPAFQVTIGGSYRRGSKDSGDIDFIVTRPDADIERVRTVILNKLIPKLFSTGFLKAALAATSDDGSKWHGACCLPGQTQWRRIDFLLVPWAEMGAALIYFTGNDIFNRSMRLLASKKGYRLNQRGLYKDVMRGKSREKIAEGTLVESRDERNIFDILGVPWRLPEHRIP